jgi:hypothetical protein
MPRKRRTLDRDGGTVRDASLVIIASEDKYAVSQYFRMFRTRRVVFKVLETRVKLAMSRAKELDIDEQDLPARPVTRVYRLLELLLRRDGIHLRPSTSSPN